MGDMEFITNKKVQEMWKKRREEIYKEHQAGASYQKLSWKWKISASRIGQIVQQEYDKKSTG